MGKPEIGIAFIGTGGVAHMHAAAVKQLPQARLVGAYSRNPRTSQRSRIALAAAAMTLSMSFWKTRPWTSFRFSLRFRSTFPSL